MNPQRWDKMAELYHAACDLAPAERNAFLVEACQGDLQLQREIESLLRQDASRHGVLERVAEDAQSRTVPDRHLPSAIGPYRVIGLVGEGGMGAVYEAEQENPRRTVALKVVRPGLPTPELFRRFEQESQALGRLQHPGIAQIYEAGVANTDIGPQPYFAMEFIRGLSLLEYAAAQRLNTRQRLDLMMKVCEAAHHAHQRGILHRDLKPGNILVDETGQPKILDFGVARVMDRDAHATRQTSLGELVGTLAYMSPEQVQGDPDRLQLDVRSDVYSLGMVLYELLAGRLPYEVGRGMPEAVRAIREDDPAPLQMLNRAYRGDLETIVGKALVKDKARRYGSADELAADLRRVLNNEPILARPPTAAYQARKFASRHKSLVIGVLAVFVVLIAGIAASSWQAIRANRAEQSATRERIIAQQESASAKAVSDFLKYDLLAQAGARAQAGSHTRPDPDLKVRVALDRAAARIAGKFASQPLIEAAIRQTIGITYRDMGLSAPAHPQIERALDIRRRVLGPEHFDTLTSMNELALLYENDGNWAAAEALVTKVLQIDRRLHRQSTLQTLAAMNQLAIAAGGQGHYSRAAALFSDVLQMQRQILGDQHPDTLGVMNNLATQYVNQGKYAQAEPLFESLVESKRRVLGEEHPSTLMSVNSLGVLYRYEGKYPQAEGLLTVALDTRRRAMGTEHKDTLSSLNSIGLLYQAEGKYAQAESILEGVVKVRRRVLGEQHPETLAVMHNLAELYLREGKRKMAESLFNKVLQMQRRVGPDKPGAINTLAALGRLKLEEHAYGKAEMLLRESLRGYQKTTSDSWRRYYTQSMLGASLAGQGKHSEARPLLTSGYEGMLQRQNSIPWENRATLVEVRQWLPGVR